MANIIHVAPAQLKSTATTFEGKATEIKNLTTSMTQAVQQLTGRVWSGDAKTAYTSKFNGLQADINKLHAMITKHASHLREIAQEYETRENENVSEANSLSSSVIS